MSFIKIEPIRAIKIYGKSYRSAHQAALAYADSATHQLNYMMHKRSNGNYPPQVGLAYMNWFNATADRFYCRSKPIFDKYFKGE